MNSRFDELDQAAADEAAAALEARGYRVVVSGAELVSCLIVGQGERWQGVGPDRAGAISHALGRMLPSRLARALWSARAAGASDEVRAPERAADAPRGEARAALEVVAPEAPGEADGGHVEAAAPASPIALVEAPSAPAPSPEPRTHVTRSPAPPLVIRSPPPPSVSDADTDAAVARIQAERAATAADRPRLARLAPELLRLELLARVSRLRAIQESCPADEVERAAASGVRDLTSIAKAWWPGSVSAMQLKATPLDAGDELGLANGGRLHDWAEAAEAAAARLAAVPAELEAAGRDADGWADGRACSPAPSAPDDLLASIQAAVDKAVAARPGDAGELETLAARLRWLRPHVKDAEAWADAVGKLRRRATMRSLGVLPGLTRRLAAETHPATSWARELGEDPEARALKQKRKALMRRSPVAGTPEEDVLAWLAAALELGDELPNAKIVKALDAHKELLLGLGPEDLPRAERMHRRRLRALQAAIRGEAGGDDGDDEEDDELEGEGEVAVEAEVEEDAAEAEVVRLRSHVDGKRALFLTNRASPEIESELRERLGLDVTLSLVDQRRRQNAARSLSHGGYDLVIVANRFVGHDVDFDLGPRAKEAGIPYVRASSGRFGSVVRALVRDLGVA